MVSVILRVSFLSLLGLIFVPYLLYPVYAKTSSIDTFEARPPIHIRKSSQINPPGLSPDQVKAMYHLPQSGGSGTIAIIAGYDDPTVENDLNVFSKQFNLPACTSSNGCFEVHKIVSSTKANSGWEGETSLDTQWAHAIAPKAKILLVEAKTAGGKDLLAAVDYARKRADVVSISMSWGGQEFSSEETMDSYFKSSFGAVFFAASGDNGFGVQWPATSVNVIGVGGTTPHFSNSAVTSETAWLGSGGGISSFVAEPSFQLSYGLNSKKRSVPDVAYAADPNPGFSVYHKGWIAVGGTSAGAPQWAALHSLGKDFTILSLYHDASGKKYTSYFRDIIRGLNGDCGTVCKAGKAYDTVTGLGSPLTTLF